MNTVMHLQRKERKGRRVAWQSDRGAEIVEFALILPVLLLLGLGICDFGLLFQRYEVVTNAAREGARAAATGASNSEIVTVVGQYLTAGGLTSQATVQIQTLAVGNLPLNAVKVSVSYPNGSFFMTPFMEWFGSASNIVTLRSAATMRLEIQAS